MWTISAIKELNVFIAPSTPNMISGKHLSSGRSRHPHQGAGNFQILRNPGGTKQYVPETLFFPPSHESLGMRLTLIVAIQEHPYV